MTNSMTWLLNQRAAAITTLLKIVDLLLNRLYQNLILAFLKEKILQMLMGIVRIPEAGFGSVHK